MSTDKYRSLDGTMSLSDQTLALQKAEALRHEVLGMIPEIDTPPNNTVSLRLLSPTEARPTAITLSDKAPVDKKVFWMGIIYADGKLTPAVAYR